MKKLYTIAIATLFALTAAAGCGKKDNEKKQDPAKTAAPEDGDKKEDPAREHRTPMGQVDPAKTGAAEPAAVAKPGTPAVPVANAAEAEKLLAEFGPKVEEFMNALIAAADAAGDDCTKLGPAAIKIFQDNSDVLAKMASTNHTEAATKWRTDHGDLMQKFGGKMQAVGKCAATDKALMDVLNGLPR